MHLLFFPFSLCLLAIQHNICCLIQITPFWLQHAASSAKEKTACCVCIFSSLSVKRSLGFRGEMRRWSCPLSGAEIHFSRAFDGAWIGIRSSPISAWC